MAIQFPDFQRISFDEANPFLTGFGKGFNLSKDVMSFPQELQAKILANKIATAQAKYAEPTMKENLTSLQQRNLFNPRIWESEIGLRGAQTGLAKEQTKWLPSMSQAEISVKEAEAIQKSVMAKALQDILSGNFGGQSQASPENTNLGTTSFNAPINTETTLGGGAKLGMNQGGQPTLNPSQSSLTYPQAAVLSKMLGLGKPEIIDEDGKKTAVTPFGNIQVGQGLTALQKNLSKQDAQKISSFEQAAFNGVTRQEIFDDLSQLVTNPVFEQMRQNPIAGKYELLGYSRFGSPEQKELVGKYMTLTGDIIKQSASDFKGQFRVGEQALLNSMKPNMGDSLETMKGKIEALSFMNKMLIERSRITAYLMREKGMSLISASAEADKSINGKEIRKSIENNLKNNKKSASSAASLSDEELLKIIEG